MSLLRAGILLVVTLQSALGAIVTTTADSGPGSLRAAIASAAQGEAITFSVTGAVTLTSGQLSIARSIHVVGPGASVLAVERNPLAPPFRIFDISAGLPSISGLTIRNGACDLSDDSGAGIQNRGNISVLDCVFENNVATDRGGAIYNAYMSSCYISNCVFKGNASTGDYGEGGALYALGNAFVLNSSFLNNAVHDRGGGLQVDMFGAVLVSGCTFSGNSAVGREGQGGGIYNFGRLAMTNCTLSRNIANDSGGALHNDSLALDLRIDSCTIVSNAAPQGGGLYLNGFNPSPQPRHLHNSIVSGNQGDIHSRINFVSDGFNLIGSSSGTQPLVLTATDRINVSPEALHLGDLRDNGGLTATYALLPGSLAFENGDDAHHPATDQRGVGRPHYSHCDVGAFEVNNLSPAIACTFTNVECGVSSAAFSVLVSDPDGDALTVIWGSFGSEFQTNYLAAGTTFAPVLLSATRPLGPGLNFIPVLVFDGLTESMSCLATVNALDTQPPAIEDLRAAPDSLWPANHKMVPVTLTVSAHDDCGGNVTSRIKSISSNDPTSAADKLDWEITGALTANLRAESAPGPKNRRVYSLTVESLDEAGNAATKTVNVAVSRN
jgi:predicted outer membrane repeat protein